MDVPSQNPGDPLAAAEYANQLARLNSLQNADRRLDRWLGLAKLALAAGGIAAAAMLVHFTLMLAPLIVLVSAFVVLFILHEKLLERMRRRARIITYYDAGMARLHGEWRGRGEDGERYLDLSHVYARDLDLFGNASVFQYLCVARTVVGQNMLARWLLEPAPVDEILARQEAVRDLSSRLKFREDLASTGETVRNAVHPDSLSAWGERKPILSTKATRMVTSILALLWIAGIVFWAISGSWTAAIVISLLNFAYAHQLHARLDRAAGAIEKAAGDLRLIAELLAIGESEAFTSPLLVRMQETLKRDGKQPSAAIGKLAWLSETIQSRHSLFARPLDMVTFWSAQLVFVAEGWQREFGPSLREWLGAIGTMEAFSSLATFAHEHPQYTFPQFVTESPLLELEALAHPLLGAEAVANNMSLGPGPQLMILSGPNMAGKSTFIRSVGVNVVLAQCGAPVRALGMRLSPLQVGASICILDSLTGGVSRFYAEIRRIKVIVGLAEGPIPVLFLLDELLSGTNSHDRLIGTEFVLRQLIEHGAIGIVSTHDLALAKIPDAMSGVAFNAHFADRLEDGELVFNYKLTPGVVQTSNALKLMRSIGLGVPEQ